MRNIFELKANKSITAILTTSFFIVSLVGLLILGGLLLFFNIRIHQTAIYNKQQLVAQNAARTVSNFLIEKINVLESIFWIFDPNEITPTGQREILQGLLGVQPSFKQVIMLNKENKEVIRVSRRSLMEAEKQDIEFKKEISARTLFGSPYISPVYIDKFSFEPLLIIALPYRDVLGKIQGSVVVEINLKFMWDLVDQIKIGETGYTYVVDKNGNLISFGDPSRVLKNENVKHISAVADFLSNENTLYSPFVSNYTGIKQIEVVGTYVPLGTPDWAVVAELPWNEAYRQPIIEIFFGFIATVLIVLVISTLGVYFAKRLSVPIISLMKTATLIAKGEKNILAEVKGPSEIAALAEAFNSMTTQLRKTNTELEEQIAEVKRAEKVLREKTLELDSYFTNTLDLLCIADTDGYFHRLNKQWELTLGYSLQELEGRKFLDFVHWEDMNSTLEVIAKLGNQEEVLNFVNRYRCKDGTYRWLEWRSFPSGNLIYAIARDITERKRADETKRLLAHTMESISEVATITDLEDKYTFVNDAFLYTYGYTREEVLGKHVSLVWSPNNPPELQKQILEQSRIMPWRGEVLNVTKDGREFPVLLRTSQVRDENGTIIGLVGIAEDISERKQLEAQLMQSQKMEAVGRLAGGIAHDFNNMISVILGYASLLEKSLTPSDPLMQSVNAITDAAQRSANLTKQLLAYARRQVIMPIAINLNDVLTTLSKMLARLLGEDISINLNLADNLWNIKVDPTQLDQILANLATNARDTIEDVGTIIIETSNVVIDSFYTQEHLDTEPGEYVLLTFSDSGKGIDKETQSKIFDPFFTTKPKGQGTGLGLATVFGIMKQNNGFISVYSELGQGTTFKLYFPRFYGESERPSEYKFQEPSRRHETVLIVEDEKDLLDLNRITLEMYGYKVLTAQSPGDAILIVEQKKQQIHLLITDVVMPGMNGKELRNRLEAIIPNLKTIFMSGYTADVVANRGILEKGMHFIQKPFKPNELVVMVQKVLNKED